MAEGLQTPDGTAVDVEAAETTEREFARAMASPPGDIPPPPKKPPADPPPKKRGRPPKTDQPRVAPAQPAVPAPALDKQRADGVKGFAQMGAGLCLVMDSRTPDTNISWRADAVTLANAAEPLAAACVEVAKANPAFAAVLDKVTKVGPYGALVSVGLSVAGQLAMNHGVKAGAMLGGKPPAEILAALEPDDDTTAAA